MGFGGCTGGENISPLRPSDGNGVCVVTKEAPLATHHASMTVQPGSRTLAAPRTAWRGEVQLRFQRRGHHTCHQGGAKAPLKLQRSSHQASGHCLLPLLHTAGGLVGGDALVVEAQLGAGSQALLTSVAAQKVYGSVGRFRSQPQGRWSRQQLTFKLAAGSDLEWLPQDLVLFSGALYEQEARAELNPGASFLTAEVVRLGRTAAGECLDAGRWRSCLEIVRLDPSGQRRWELVDRLELGGANLGDAHGLAHQPVFGSLAWASPEPLKPEVMERLLAACRKDRAGLEGEMACGALDQGLVARYRGSSSQAARFWFTRIWVRIRMARNLPPPEIPRVWPFQEHPLTAPLP